MIQEKDVDILSVGKVNLKNLSDIGEQTASFDKAKYYPNDSFGKQLKSDLFRYQDTSSCDGSDQKYEVIRANQTDFGNEELPRFLFGEKDMIQYQLNTS